MSPIQTFRAVGAALAAALVLAACGGGGGSTPAPVAPTVTSTVPVSANPAPTGVATDSHVAVTFSKTMAPASLTAASFTLACPAGVPVAGTLAYDASARTATLTPTTVLPAGTLCVAQVTTANQDSTGLALAAAHGWSFTTSPLADTSRPTVSFTVPADLEGAAATNGVVTATFSEDMLPASLSAASFSLVNTTLGVAVPGTVTYSVASRSATFTPTVRPLAASNLYTATISVAATDVAGNALAGTANVAGASPHVWSFTTAASADVTPPTLTKSSPLAGATDVCLTKIVSATFSEDIDAASVTGATFGVSDNGAAVAGSTRYDATSRIATFTPTAAAGFVAGRPFVATLKSGIDGVKDLAGNALAADQSWTFNTGSQACAAGPTLGVVAAFGTFAGAGGITSQGLNTWVDGNMASPVACSQVTGLHDAFTSYTQTPQNAGTVNGFVFCAPPLPGTPTGQAVAAQVLREAQAAYAELLAMAAGADPAAGQLGGQILLPAVYTAAGGTFSITAGDLILDAQGDPNAVWIFQSATALNVGLVGTPRRVLLINGARARNVFWQTGGAARVEDGSTLVGTLVVQTGASFSTPGQVLQTTLVGRVTSLAGPVSLVNTRIVAP